LIQIGNEILKKSLQFGNCQLVVISCQLLVCFYDVSRFNWYIYEEKMIVLRFISVKKKIVCKNPLADNPKRSQRSVVQNLGEIAMITI
jgi:hypothetical protein